VRSSLEKESTSGGLQRRQDESLGLKALAPIREPRDAERFLSHVGLALRYGPTKGLPLASLYRAFAGHEPDKPALTRGIALTNQLLGKARAIEVHVVADRVTLIHASVMPPLYALIRRGRALNDLDGLSVSARTAFSLLRERKEITAGDLRQHLGLPFDTRRDPAYAALGELQRLLLVDRGPFQIPESGIPYLSKEGYPYHFFHEAHPDLTGASSRYSVTTAAEEFLTAYLNGAVFARVRRLATLFKALLSSEEIEAAVQRLERKRKVGTGTSGRDTIVFCT
jgi:hypothetical protein